MCLEHPGGSLNIASERIDQDFVLVEFQHEIWEPPALFALQTRAVSMMARIGSGKTLCKAARASAAALCKGLGDSRRCGRAGGQGETARVDDADGQ